MVCYAEYNVLHIRDVFWLYVGLFHFVYEYYNHELYNFDVMLDVEDTDATCYVKNP